MARPTPPTPPLWTTLIDSVQQTRTDMPRGWRAQLRQTAEDLDAFYLAQEQRHALTTKNPVWRWFVRAWWLVKALFFRLSPIRRVVFVAAVLLLIGSKDVSGSDSGAVFNANTVLLGAALLVILLMLELKDKLLARHELQAGRAVQQALMPGAAPAVPGWDVWLYTRPANDVGGDLVDALAVGSSTGLVLADVAGKALPAALLMAKVQATLRALATEVPSLAALAERANTILCRDGLPNRFATMVYLGIEAGTGRVRLVNAGHQPPIVVSGEKFHELPPGGMALGLMPGSAYTEQDIDLQPGEALVIYSDGVTEAMNGAGEFFGDDRLQALLSDPRPVTAEQYGRRLLASVDTFMGDTRPYDDLSLIVAKRTA